MKYLFMLAFAGIIAATPVYLYETLVTPQLEQMTDSYRNYDQVAQDVATASAPKN